MIIFIKKRGQMKSSILLIIRTILLSFCFILLSNLSLSSQNPTINEAISLIHSDSILYQTQWLQDMGTRFMMAPNHKEVASHIAARFESYGIQEVRLDSFECNTYINYSILHYDTTTWQYNVEAKILGSLYPEEEILIMGHYDNVQLDSDPEIYAPGADDNASGTAAALESARVLMQMGYQPERTIVFLCTAAEELMNFGYSGAKHYAQNAAQENRNIIAVINNDMIAYDEGSSEISFSNIIGSEEITGIASYIANTYTSLTPDIDPPSANTGADLKAFVDLGYRGLYLMETIFNPFYHSEQDLVEHIDLNYLTEAIKISCGSLIYSDIYVGQETISLLEPKLTVFPNPCTERINIQLFAVHEPCQISLINTSGQLVFTKSIDQDLDLLTNIDMSSFQKGAYILKIESFSFNINKVIIHQ